MHLKKKICCGLGNRIYLAKFFCKFARQVDKLGHNDRYIDHETQRQKAIEKELGCKFIRINPDEQNHNIFKAINEIHRPFKKSTKKSLIKNLSKRLLV